MNNLSNGTNNSGANKVGVKFNFLGKGIYDVLSITKQEGEKGMQYIAEVRRFSNGRWNNEKVNLYYLFKNESRGPRLQFALNTLADSVINITSLIKQTSASGKPYFDYIWEVDVESTKVIKEEIEELVNEQNYQDECNDLLDQELINDMNIQNEYDWANEWELMNEQNIEAEIDWLNEQEEDNERNIQDDLEDTDED